jgi:hypothetical protein
MKKATKRKVDQDMLDEHDFSKGVRDQYARRYVAGRKIVVLAPDLAEIFPNSAAVNEALRSLVKLARKVAKKASA